MMSYRTFLVQILNKELDLLKNVNYLLSETEIVDKKIKEVAEILMEIHSNNNVKYVNESRSGYYEIYCSLPSAGKRRSKRHEK